MERSLTQRYEQTCREFDLYFRPTQRTSPRSAPVRALDPIAVGRAARQYQTEQRAAGVEISATQAVALIMAQGR